MWPPRLKQMRAQIRKIGCIHFDEAGSMDPLFTIRVALKGREEALSDALIVLPEALDLANDYYTPVQPGVKEPNKCSRFGVRGLQDLSREFDVAFVAGLSEKTWCHTYNSAFLIDPELTLPLSRKMNSDITARWYEGSDRDPQCVRYRGLTIACLICKDAQDFKPAPNCQRLHKIVLNFLRREQLNNHPVLCVPARMTLGTPSLEANQWPKNISIIVANIDTQDGHHSGIRAADGGWKPCREELLLECLPCIS